MPQHVLDGIRVLDFTRVLAGPTTTRLMAEMGAEIIKIELTPEGDVSRQMPWFRNGRSGYFIQQNRGKKSVCVNPRAPKAQELLKRLVTQCDVLVENFAPGVIGRIGLDWETVHALNPRLVMCSISAFGQTGPLANLPGYDYIAASYAAVIGMIGEPDEAPYFPMLGLGDVGTGVHALAAISSALFYREKTGRGQFIDVSLLDAYFHCHEVNVQICSGSNEQIKPTRSGRHHYAVCPLGMFRCRDGYIFIVATDTNWKTMCELMGQPDMATDPRFKNNGARTKNQTETIALIEGWLADKDASEAVRLLQGGWVPSAPILSVVEAMNHPHLVERRTVRLVDDPVFGQFRIPGFPFRFSEFPDELPLIAPYLGQHNEEVLGGYLGVSDADLHALEAEGVLKSKPDRVMA
jgi:crotonobetainyl-CoA:carnitine CoA-transferase CaiB-like acyl-CoA transferase